MSDRNRHNNRNNRRGHATRHGGSGGIRNKNHNHYKDTRRHDRNTGSNEAAAEEAAAVEVQVDGAQLEGGGQVVRVAAGVGALLRKSLRIHSVRAGRRVAGLRPQHLAGVQLVSRLAACQLHGAAIGSTAISLHPTAPLTVQQQQFEWRVDTGTAGAVTLLVQAVLPLLLLHTPLYENTVTNTTAPSTTSTSTTTIKRASSLRLLLVGGTDVPYAPPLDYFRHALLPMLHHVLTRNAIELPPAMRLSCFRRGFYPKGGGVVELSVEPPSRSWLPLSALQLADSNLSSRTALRRLQLYSCFNRHDPTLVAKLAEGARSVLHEFAPEVLLEIATDDTEEQNERDKDITGGRMQQQSSSAKRVRHGQDDRDSGALEAGVVLVATMVSGLPVASDMRTSITVDVQGQRSTLHDSLHELGKSAASQLVETIQKNICVDSFMQDQLVVFAALAEGISVVRMGEPTLHTRTAAAVASQLTGATYSFSQQSDGVWHFQCNGCGFTAA